jgi:hypothetical protein
MQRYCATQLLIVLSPVLCKFGIFVWPLDVVVKTLVLGFLCSQMIHTMRIKSLLLLYGVTLVVHPPKVVLLAQARLRAVSGVSPIEGFLEADFQDDDEMRDVLGLDRVVSRFIRHRTSKSVRKTSLHDWLTEPQRSDRIDNLR